MDTERGIATIRRRVRPKGHLWAVALLESDHSRDVIYIYFLSSIVVAKYAFKAILSRMLYSCDSFFIAEPCQIEIWWLKTHGGIRIASAVFVDC
jgi:hypothetical protein